MEIETGVVRKDVPAVACFGARMAELHKGQLLDNWRLAMGRRSLTRIEPLE